MKHIVLVVQREFLTRVRKKSYWIMAILGPVFVALGLIVPLWIGSMQEENKVVAVIDESGKYAAKFVAAPGIEFEYLSLDAVTARAVFLKSSYYALLHIPGDIVTRGDSVKLFTRSRIQPEIKYYVEKNLNQFLTEEKLRLSGIPPEILSKAKTSVAVSNINLGEDWKDEDANAAAVVVALFSAIMIMFFIVIYGGQVMRGVVEEKTNRIVELIVTSVNSFHLMAGKIIGVGLVSLVQFLIWLLLTSGLSYLINSRYEKVFDAFSDEKIEQTIRINPQLDVMQAAQINRVVHAVSSIDFAEILFFFGFYFVTGFLLYASLFSVIGALADSETDTQQFVFPLIAPLMTVVVLATGIMNDPHGELAYWLSVIPFTSPVAMMLRIPFDVPMGQLLLSMVVLIVSFMVFTWLSSKVYRAAILMYGKKWSFYELFRLLKL